MKFILILLTCMITPLFAATNELVVGSTFDYPPLTYLQDGKYLGDDIKMMQDFSRDNKFILQWVKTSWPNLKNDLLTNKFTVAAGGISDNLERRKLFLISNPLYVTRKAALIRCADISKFRTLAAIDSSTTRVVENAGGTNRQFAAGNLKNAQIITVANNQLPFEYLLQNKADVMFTDDVEVNYKHQKNSLLCMAKLDAQFPATNKVVLFANNENGKRLQLKFNAWWQNNKATYHR